MAAEPAPGKARERVPAETSYVVVTVPVNCKLLHVVEVTCSNRRAPDGAENDGKRRPVTWWCINLINLEFFECEALACMHVCAGRSNNYCWRNIVHKCVRAFSSLMPDWAADSFTDRVTLVASATADDRDSTLPLYCVVKMGGNEPKELASSSKPLESTSAAGMLSLPGLLWDGFMIGPKVTDTGAFAGAAASNVYLFNVWQGVTETERAVQNDVGTVHEDFVRDLDFVWKHLVADRYAKQRY